MSRIEDIMLMAPVIPVLTIEEVAHARPIAEALVAGGLPVLEVTLRTSTALDVIREMKQVPGAIVGAGTVLNEYALDDALTAGSEFIVSPGLTESLAKAAIAANVPFLPGTLLVWAAIAVWVFAVGTTAAWVVLGIVTAILGAGILIKYLWPAKRMKAAEVSNRTLVAGAILGIIGFFVIPVAGLLLGFVLGVYLAEFVQRRDRGRAWASTKHALKGVALSVGVELSAALLATAVWIAGVVL